MIVIAGLPGSGNHLVMRAIQNWMEHAGRRREITVWHGQKPLNRPRRAEDVRFIFTTRIEEYRVKSVDRRRINEHGTYDGTTGMLRTMMSEAILRGAKPKLISYEGLMQNFDSVTRDLAEWLGYEWVAYNRVVEDGNRKYQLPSHTS